MGVSKNDGTPKSSHFNRVFQYKPSILGYHYFWKHPNGSNHVFFFPECAGMNEQRPISRYIIIYIYTCLRYTLYPPPPPPKKKRNEVEPPNKKIQKVCSSEFEGEARGTVLRFDVSFPEGLTKTRHGQKFFENLPPPQKIDSSIHQSLLLSSLHIGLYLPAAVLIYTYSPLPPTMGLELCVCRIITYLYLLQSLCALYHISCMNFICTAEPHVAQIHAFCIHISIRYSQSVKF